MKYTKSLTREEALQKLRHYCGYQERCHSEVREKLFNLGARRSDHDEIIASLIQDNYLNEERFAIAFAGGRFRVKHWGRVKIRYELKQKQVSEYCIKKAIKQIDEDDYLAVLQKLVEDKYASVKRGALLVRKKKTIDHLRNRGFELDLVLKAIARI